MSRPKQPRLVGGALCLDFVNSVDPREGAEPQDYLGDYGELLSWALHAGAVRPEEAKRLRRRADARVWHRTIAFREGLYPLLRTVAEGGHPDPRQLAALEPELAGALARPALTVGPDGSVRESLPEDPALPLWRVALSARDLLLALPDSRLRVCAGDHCGWLFLDASRAGRRRWCSMAGCGNRAKARRHYARHRAATR